MHNSVTEDVIAAVVIIGLFGLVLFVGGWLLERFPRLGRLLERMFKSGNDIINAVMLPSVPEPIQPKYPQSSWRTDPNGKITLLSVQWRQEQQKSPLIGQKPKAAGK